MASRGRRAGAGYASDRSVALSVPLFYRGMTPNADGPPRFPQSARMPAAFSERPPRQAGVVNAPVILPLPCSSELVPEVSAVRGTVLLASIHALREMKLFDDYRAKLPPDMAAEVLSVVPGQWVALKIATAHYRACEDLQLHPTVQLDIGRCAGTKAMGVMLGTAVRLSRVVGATPWTLLKGADRIWNRAYSGGAMRVYQMGANDALVETHANPLLSQLGFCRTSFKGFSLSLYGALSERISIRESDITAGCVSFRMVWK